MQAPTWIDKNIENKRSQEYQMRIHQNKLEQIAMRGHVQNQNARSTSVVGPSNAKKVTSHLRKYKQDKARAKDFQTSEKNLMISKDNQILLSKLVEISSGKWSSLPQGPQKQQRKSASQSRVFQPQSLNLGVRKRETDRIERENHAFAKRLFDKQAVLQKQSLDKAYQEHLRYKKSIAKAPPVNKKMQQSRTVQRQFPSQMHGYNSQVQQYEQQQIALEQEQDMQMEQQVQEQVQQEEVQEQPAMQQQEQPAMQEQEQPEQQPSQDKQKPAVESESAPKEEAKAETPVPAQQTSQADEKESASPAMEEKTRTESQKSLPQADQK